MEDILKLAALAEADDSMTDVTCHGGDLATLSVFKWGRTFTYRRSNGEIVSTGRC